MHKNFTRSLAWLAIGTVLTGCAATGKSYSERMATLAAPSSDSARITLYRGQDTFQYSGRDARVMLDGATLGKVSHLGFSVFTIPAGKHVLSVDMWDNPGGCKLPIEAAPASDGYYEVEPRAGNLVGILAGGLIGAAIETAGKDCGGAFSVVERAKDEAQSVLPKLKDSN